MIEFESILKANLNNYMDDVYICLPAIVVGIQNIQDGIIDVQPLINHIFADGTKSEYPTIYSVPVIMPCTSTSSITMPVNQGDSVLLMVCQRDIDVFKNGSDVPHDPSSFRQFNMNDSVALIGLSPISKSRLSPANHNMNFDNQSLILSHNVGTESESYIKFDQGGNIEVGAKSAFNLSASTISIKASAVSLEASSFDVKATVTIDGMNLNNFMKSHTHPYTDDGRPSTTGTPQGF